MKKDVSSCCFCVWFGGQRWQRGEDRKLDVRPETVKTSQHLPKPKPKSVPQGSKLRGAGQLRSARAPHHGAVPALAQHWPWLSAHTNTVDQQTDRRTDISVSERQWGLAVGRPSGRTDLPHWICLTPAFQILQQNPEPHREGKLGPVRLG